ncbi:ureidoglycolate lyase [Rhodovulum sp. YNF3179]|uniref:ureidoglycolate lyase n=1 Tax=Rhodovulum sp. YNF3179 TaxID=3425127 RepID=UPI003D33C736
MSREIAIAPLTAEAFAPFGEVIAPEGPPDAMINAGMCARYTDRATLDFAPEGRAGISLFHGQPYALPLTLALMERHPLGSQAFLPLSADPFLVIVAPDAEGHPGRPLAFRTAPGQGVNYRRGTWHGVLTPVGRPALFAVVDYIGPGANLEEHRFEVPYTVGTAVDAKAFAETPDT